MCFVYKIYKTKMADMSQIPSTDLVHVPSANMEEVGFMTCTAASHQGAVE